MKRIMFVFMLFGISCAYADTVKLSTMFQDKKDNEYAFSQKYENKRLTFDATIRSIDAKCYTKMLSWEKKNLKVLILMLYLVVLN